MKVLIVDDNRDHAESTQLALQLALQIDAAVAFDGVQALHMAMQDRPDVMLVDQSMPGMNGMEVAQGIRDHYGPDSPYLMAMTGFPLEGGTLPGIEALFDRAFAKPLDLQALQSALLRIENGMADAKAPKRPFDLAEVLTRVARQIMPIAVQRGVVISFDYRGQRIVVNDDPVSLHCSLHRLLMELLDLVETSYVLLTVDVAQAEPGRYRVGVNAAASGPLVPDAVIAAALSRLEMTAVDATAKPGRRALSAVGRCPATNAQLRCSVDSQEGVLIAAQFEYADVLGEGVDLGHDKGLGEVWFVDGHAAAPTLGERRFHGMGWRVRRFTSIGEALTAYGAVEDARDERAPASSDVFMHGPDLLVVMEMAGQALADLKALRNAIPHGVACVLAVLVGSEALGNPGAFAGYEVRTLPFSPLDVAALCGVSGCWQLLGPQASQQAALGLDTRAGVLLVDDNAVNRMVGQAMVESLGYEVRVASDGLDAIELCRRDPPQVVLMDLDMPVLKGIEATMRIRDLQRLGSLPPFAVIAATADHSEEAQKACAQAGMDAFMAKPFGLSTLRTELRRFIDPAFHPAS